MVIYFNFTIICPELGNNASNNMKHINILKLTLSTVFLLGVNSAIAQEALNPVVITGQSYDSIVQGTSWQTQITSANGPEAMLHYIYNPSSNDPEGPLNLAPGALLYASDELYEAAGNFDFFAMESDNYIPDDRNVEADLNNIDVLTIGTQSSEGSPAAEIVSIEAPTMVNNILASEALSTKLTVSGSMLVGEASVGFLTAAQVQTAGLTLVNNDPDGSNVQLDASGMGGLITRESDGLIHLGSNSFLFNDTFTNHVLTTDSGTEIILGGDIASTTGTDESKNIRVANDLNVDGDIFIDGNLGVQAQLDILNQSSSANFANAIASNSTAIASNKRSIEQNARGIAMVAALQHTTVLPGMSHALDVSAAYFEGETGMSINYARRINENVQINFGAASTDDFDESVIKAGIGFQW